ncbi:SRPBCC family protein [Nocardia sp. NPDC051990]|uniref:SRPBCC family protein n=1 Tax=Nocardia sp. NPDC051990 TaxID=3155285 RepID=UPI00344A3830
MTTIATAQAISTAAPAAFFAKWADMATWPEWNNDTEWVRLDGPFTQGASGTLKPKGGPEVPFIVERLSDREFVDVSKLIGARLIFDHQVASDTEGTTVTVTVSIEGPLRWFWTRVLGADLAKSVEPDLRALVAAAEAVLV